MFHPPFSPPKPSYLEIELRLFHTRRLKRNYLPQSLSDGNPYGIEEGLIFSMPARSTGDGSYEIVEGLEINDWLRERIAKSETELSQEKECVSHLIGVEGGACAIKEDTTLPGEA